MVQVGAGNRNNIVVQQIKAPFHTFMKDLSTNPLDSSLIYTVFEE